MLRHILARAVSALAASTLLLGACDDSFSPFAPGARPFTVYGYLDPGADTQWIRVELLRTTVATSPDPNGATVTLQDLATGRRIALRERVGQLSTMTGTSAYVHNYWTTERIAPGTTYRFMARQTLADSATATVQTPPDYGVEVRFGQYWSPGDRLRMTGLRRAAFVEERVFFDDSCGTASEMKSLMVPPPRGDTLAISISPTVPLGRGCRIPVANRWDLKITGTAADWPRAEDYSTYKPGVLQEPSNVSNALGFLGAVLTKRLPYESCQYASRPVSDTVCVLRYDSLAARVQGTTFDTWCPDSAGGYRPSADTLRSGFGLYARIPRVAVTLRELTPRAGLPPRVRTTRSDRLGAFFFDALEPGSYEIGFFRDEIPARDIDEYLPVVDTVRVGTREHTTMEVPMVGQVHCSLHPRFP